MPWQTAHKDHAIERVALSFLLAEQVPSRPWAMLHERASKLALTDSFTASPLPEEFMFPPIGGPGGQAKQFLQIAVGAGGVSVSSPGDGPSGKLFTKSADDGLFEQFSISRNLFSYAATRYSGWSTFERRAFELLGPLLDEVLGLLGLQAIKLEYWDRFVFHGDGPAPYGEVFCKESKHVPAFAFETKELWHSHSGYFVENPHANRRLVNVNLDMLDLAQPDSETKATVNRRSAGVYTMIQDTFLGGENPMTAKLAAAGITDMHDHLKKLFGDIVTDGVAAQIGLKQRA